MSATFTEVLAILCYLSLSSPLSFLSLPHRTGDSRGSVLGQYRERERECEWSLGC